MYIADWTGHGLGHKMDHLACFAAGMLMIGAQVCDPMSPVVVVIPVVVIRVVVIIIATVSDPMSPYGIMARVFHNDAWPLLASFSPPFILFSSHYPRCTCAQGAAGLSVSENANVSFH